MTIRAAGIEKGQRKLNGPQTTGRTYRNLSEPAFEMIEEHNVALPTRSGVTLLADVYRPSAPGPFPVLLSSSPYPRQIQNSGAPMGFVEAGASDFWVPRGYVHIIVNERGTNGSGGTYGVFDQNERDDLYDAIEWAAAQPYCDGSVGMLGISAFAMSQIAAAVEQPPHLRAIFPVGVSSDTYEAFYHGGLLNMTIGASLLRAIAMFARVEDHVFRSRFVGLIEKMLHWPAVHKRFEHFNGEAALAVLKSVMAKVPHDPHPWDDLLRETLVEHQLKDAYWRERDNLARAGRIRVPVYLGCDWENVPLHLPSTFATLRALPKDLPVRVSMLGRFGLTWPWESLHIEALAWFDQHLKGRDTGIMEGAPIRFVVPGEPEEVWREAVSWPPPEATPLTLALRTDGVLAPEEGDAGQREYVALPPWMSDAAPGVPTTLTWETSPLGRDVILAGGITLRLDAAISGGDTAFIVALQEVAADGSILDVTAGWRRAAVNEEMTAFESVPANELRTYRIPLVDNARRFAAGHRIRLFLRADDTTGPTPIMGFRHAPLGIASRNAVSSSSRLTLDILPS